MRFLINTTVGVLGIFDVAKDWGYPEHDTDFGMTLANWGVPEGPFLFLPVLIFRHDLYWWTTPADRKSVV